MTLQEERQQAERRAAIRALLSSPLIKNGSEAFAQVSRHHEWLGRWFDETAGWRLAVDPAAGFARLFKIPSPRAGRRGLQSRSGVPFDRRRYVLFSWVLACLSEVAGQMTVRRLAEQIHDMTRTEAGIPSFEPERASERRGFVDALLRLTDFGALTLRDGDAESYARSAEGDALYDVNDRLVTHLIGTALSPALASGPDALAIEIHPDTDEGRRTGARFEVTRTLLDEPVVYVEDLGEAARRWLDSARGWLYPRLENDVGFAVERRREGLAAVDPTGEVTDERFPDGNSTVRHAALLLAEPLSAPARREADWLPEEIGALTARLIEKYAKTSGWSQDYIADAAGADRLAEDAMALLERFGLAKRREGHWRARPALARFRTADPKTAR